MDLFLETPQQKADRILRQQERLFEMGVQPAPRDAGAAGARPEEAPPSGGSVRSSLFGSKDRAHKGRDGDDGVEACPSDEYSLEQESYRRELDYDRARHRNRRWAARLRAIATAILVPLGLVLIFLASYALTCILNGALPDEVVQHLAALGQRLAQLIAQMRASWGV